MHLADHGQSHRSIIVDLRRLIRNVVSGKDTNRDLIFRTQYVAGRTGGAGGGVVGVYRCRRDCRSC